VEKQTKIAAEIVANNREKMRDYKHMILTMPISLTKGGRPASATIQNNKQQNYMSSTEATMGKSTYISKLICGKDTVYEPSRRPKSASAVPIGTHGINGGTHRASGLEKPSKSLHNGSACFGDFCVFIKALQVAGRDSSSSEERNYDTLAESLFSGERSTEVVCQLAYKSILLAKAEARYADTIRSELGYELYQYFQHNADSDQISGLFAQKHLAAVLNKCTDDAHKIIFSSLKGDSHRSWDEINLVYKKLVYSEALAQVHPSRFYYTVPVCKDCYRIYTILDQERDTILFKRPDVYTVSADERQTLRKKKSYLDKYTTLGKQKYYEDKIKEDAFNRQFEEKEIEEENHLREMVIHDLQKQTHLENDFDENEAEDNFGTDQEDPVEFQYQPTTYNVHESSAKDKFINRINKGLGYTPGRQRNSFAHTSAVPSIMFKKPPLAPQQQPSVIPSNGKTLHILKLRFINICYSVDSYSLYIFILLYE
jgi:hypothetical protein